MRQALTPILPALLVLGALVPIACQLPETNLRQNGWSAARTIENDSLVIRLRNPIRSATRFHVRSERADISEILAGNAFHVLGPMEERSVAYPLAGLDTLGILDAVRTTISHGSLRTPIRPDTLSLPFPEGRWYRVIQGYGGGYSHNTPFSRYTLDFALAVGDTVTAAQDGVVVGVVEGYEVGGGKSKYRPYANYITVFHPGSGLFTQYVHLAPDGSLVAVGDSVSMHQSIGLSGLTGFTDRAHLHFNVLVPDSTEGMVSTPAVFEGGIEGAVWQRGSRAEHVH
ncbi:MAG: M23 family metallopeptidase [Rhodothermales bacterium]|nr:M23 family metallopeptidase [Rhodothermales bacterium]